MFIPKFIIDKNIINSELRTLNCLLKEQRELKQTLVSYLEKISESICYVNDNKDTSVLISTLESVKSNFDNVKANIDALIELRQYLITSLKQESYDSEYFEKYNNDYMNLFNKISKDNLEYFTFMNNFAKYIHVDFSKIDRVENESSENFDSSSLIDEILEIEQETLKNFPEEEIAINLDEDIDTSVPDELEVSLEELFDIEEESSLINEYLEDIDNKSISSDKVETLEKDTTPETILNDDTKILEKTLLYSADNIVLPYSTEDLHTFFTTNPEKYSSLDDIIKKEYTIKLNDIKNTPTTRFKEAFNLAKNKCNMPIAKATTLASEISFNSQLDPIIIKACNTIDELDSYIECLETNSLDKFDAFKIIYK